jgi:Reverse transcriptase (RNA-dependent DNA polymerase)
MDVEASGSRTSELSSHGDENVVQDTPPQGVVKEASEPHALRRSSRSSHPPKRWLGLHQGSACDAEDPLTYMETMARPDSVEWLGAMRSEIQSMYDNQVWNLVDLPEGAHPIENKWVFKRKLDVDGNLTTYKALLVAKSFKQIQGVDYDKTFSLVAMFKSIRILLAIVAFHDYEIWQMDVKSAFLNRDLEESVYMTQPMSFEDPNNASKVCKLKRSIYGLKQASRSWNKRFDKEIKEFGFIKCDEESCVYKQFSWSIIVFLILYVDDILLIGNDIFTFDEVKSSLKKIFSMKDLDEATYVLGIKIYRDRS